MWSFLRLWRIWGNELGFIVKTLERIFKGSLFFCPFLKGAKGKIGKSFDFGLVDKDFIFNGVCVKQSFTNPFPEGVSKLTKLFKKLTLLDAFLRRGSQGRARPLIPSLNLPPDPIA